MSKHYLVSIFTLTLLMLLNVVVSAQENLLLYTTKVSIDVKNKKLREVLDDIERTKNLTFSYKAGLIKENALITVDFDDQPLNIVLDSLIANDSLEFYPLGRQVVIYKPTSGVKTKKIVVRDTLEQIVLRKDTVQVKVLKRDTVYVTKTDTLYDSIFVKDPYPVFDTIFMDKPKIEYTLLYSYNRFSSNRTFSEASFPLLDVPNNEAAQDLFNDSESEKGSINRFALMAKLNLNNSFYSKIGAGISIRKWKADYDFTTIYVDSTDITGYQGEPSPIYEITQRVFFEELGIWIPTDSIISGYDYSGLSPIYRLRGSYQKYNGTNRIVYFTLPIYLGYEQSISEDNTLVFETGLILDFAISLKGKSLANTQYARLEALSKMPFTSIVSYWSLKIAYKRTLTDDLSAFFSVDYARQLNQTYGPSYPISQKLNTFGFSAGVEF